MMVLSKDYLKNRLPNSIVVLLSFLLHPINNYKSLKKDREFKRRIGLIQEKHKEALAQLRMKKPIRCVFLALFDSVWKYDNVYSIMENDERFEPIILVCPIVNYGESNMIERMDACYKSLQNKGYNNVIKAYDNVSRKYVDLREDLHPDIIFYTNPYSNLIDDRYYIDSFDDILTVYVPYFYSSNCDYTLSYNIPLHNLVWRRYVESDFHKDYSAVYSFNKGKNVVVTGFPGIDFFIDPHYIPHDAWLNKNHQKKRIIWAPHHTIEPVGLVYYSCFLKYMDFMLFMAKKYVDSIELCFKPHPLLKNKLYELWGKEKTDNYYNVWSKGANTCYVEGDYVDLFLTSDAMIHDSASFIVEYLFVNKPVMRTSNGEELKKQFSSFGLHCLDQYYMAYNEQDIEQFILNVINGVDPLKEQRTQFVNEFLMPKGGLPSENIINDIIYSITNQRL